MNLIILLAVSAFAQDVPYQLRGAGTNQSIGALNQNFTDQTTLHHDQLTKTITPASCPAGQSLTGAYYNNGYQFGGVCSAVASTSSTNTFSGTTIFNSSVTFNGAIFGNILSTWTAVSANPTVSGSSAFGGCSATATITMQGSTVTIWGSGAINPNASLTGIVGVLMDGAYVAGQTTTKGVFAGLTSSGNDWGLSFERLLTGVASGKHNFCIGYYGNGSVTFSAPANSIAPQFGVREEVLLK